MAASKPRKVSGVSDFRRPAGHEVDLPSGNRVVVKRPGVQTFLKMNIIPSFLRPLVEQAIKKGKGLPPINEAKVLQETMEDQEKLDDIMRAFDRITAECWITPPVVYHQEKQEDGSWQDIPEEDRDTENYVYTDEIDYEDKVFTFNYCVGGVKDLERFRQQHGRSVGTVRRGQDVGMSAE